MNKFDKQVLVVRRSTLFNAHYFEGFNDHESHDFESIILSNYQYLRRGDAETDPSWQQPIAYCLLVNPQTKKVFTYQRANDIKKAGEKRLHNKWSWGVGGHIDKEDEASNHPILTSMLRELKEETGINKFITSKLLGYINLDDDAVGEVHFGLLYLLETDLDTIPHLAEEIAQGEFKTIDELHTLSKSDDCLVEGWSQIALEPLKKYFNT